MYRESQITASSLSLPRSCTARLTGLYDARETRVPSRGLGRAAGRHSLPTSSPPVFVRAALPSSEFVLHRAPGGFSSTISPPSFSPPLNSSRVREASDMTTPVRHSITQLSNSVMGTLKTCKTATFIAVSLTASSVLSGATVAGPLWKILRKAFPTHDLDRLHDAKADMELLEELDQLLLDPESDPLAVLSSELEEFLSIDGDWYAELEMAFERAIQAAHQPREGDSGPSELRVVRQL
ncbi:unnamed protein product [Cyclocybe aegerita]|uniref:Uncharacterized protein n=1 Tax=Cyclocybe aegerita TaxID=1973307 RepID=A0A8S0WIE7_CYCAE|nr:unnamed protein product [Cyclocybe aegerita]